ncbi:MAG: hypothetical protein AB1758_33895, partial [Candidatus Eremiobacterota bacterium]
MLATRTVAPTRPPGEQPSGAGECAEKILRKVAGAVVGLVFGTSGLFVNAAAGGARGVVHGARIESHRKAVFTG